MLASRSPIAQSGTPLALSPQLRRIRPTGERPESASVAASSRDCFGGEVNRSQALAPAPAAAAAGPSRASAASQALTAPTVSAGEKRPSTTQPEGKATRTDASSHRRSLGREASSDSRSFMARGRIGPSRSARPARMRRAAACRIKAESEADDAAVPEDEPAALTSSKPSATSSSGETRVAATSVPDEVGRGASARECLEAGRADASSIARSSRRLSRCLASPVRPAASAAAGVEEVAGDGAAPGTAGDAAQAAGLSKTASG
mmetsp:Transcript_13699/g.52178  ORF Transcript_13699/g.52178 Transcript_13699/m.52178 type:complete len:262 (-) Transcript_13699:1304-2089(-)